MAELLVDISGQIKKHIDNFKGTMLYYTSRYDMLAALAQSVERRLGKAEVGGSSPLGSFDTDSSVQRVVYPCCGVHLFLRYKENVRYIIKPEEGYCYG